MPLLFMQEFFTTNINIPIEHSWQFIDGFFHPPEVKLYNKLATLYPGGSLAEIGSWKGRSLSSVLPTLIKLNYSHIVSIDTWEGSSNEIGTKENPGPHYEATTVDLYGIFKQNMIDRGFWDYISTYKGDSSKAALNYNDEEFDLVFIDGNHTYEYVIKDIQSWYPKVKNNGILFGHDQNFEGVRKALKEFFPEENFIINHPLWIHSKDNNYLKIIKAIQS